jgi:outer membrane immunogenic protein
MLLTCGGIYASLSMCLARLCCCYRLRFDCDRCRHAGQSADVHQGAPGDGLHLRLERVLPRCQRRLWLEQQLLDRCGPSFGGLPESCKNATGGFAGGQIGYRWQSSNWVFGLEAQGDWADLSGQAVSAPASLAGDRTKISAFGLFTGQIGYAWNNVLVYAKGGAAVTDNGFDHIDLFITNLPYDSAKQTRWGGTVGAGLEYGFAPNWSMAFEYNHLFMGTQTVQFYALSGAPNNIDRIKQDVDLFSGRLNYHFNWGGPVVARY